MCSRILEPLRIGVIALCVTLIFSKEATAVVGTPDAGMDEFQAAALEEFHEKLTDEEKVEEEEDLAMRDDILAVLKKKRRQLKEATGDEREVLESEIELLKQQVLHLPERRKFLFETKGDYKYDTNIDRKVPNFEKGDSVFEAGSTARFDLSGRRTDLRFELDMRKQWNIHLSEKDFWEAGERLRYRRKHMRKLLVSGHSRTARNSQKTVEIDAAKIRWDMINQISANLPLTKKMAFNLDLYQEKRLFTQEAFDEDSTWQVKAAPSAFWNFTPKSRLSLGYSYGASRGRDKTTWYDAHDWHLGYFGQVTRKSSASIDLAMGRQYAKSTINKDSDSWTVGAGYIWQMTPKSQLTVQATRSLQNSTSDLTSGDINAASTTSKEEIHLTTDTVTLSANSALRRGLSAVASASMTHSHEKTIKDKVTDAEKEAETRFFNFPVSVRLTYNLQKWATLTGAYTFAFRTGDEKADTYRAHTWEASLRLVF